MNNFKDKLLDIQKELSNYHNNRAKLIEFYINKRLNESLATYYDTLNKSINYLRDKDEIKVLKKLGKENDK